MNNTPNANRLHIGIYGRRNVGKSSLLNLLTGQQVALVSSTPGTTTDPVRKAMELPQIGPCLFIDTAGFDDDDVTLGEARCLLTEKTLDEVDVALLVLGANGMSSDTGDLKFEKEWLARLKKRSIPAIIIMSNCESLTDAEMESLVADVAAQLGKRPVVAKNRQILIDAILAHLPEDFGTQTITGELCKAGDLVLLVMPQDIQAPKGRLILPQVQTMRELLDKKCLVMSCTTDQLSATLAVLNQAPHLIITDSQVFSEVYALKPESSLLTSFSVLMAGYKGDIRRFVEGANVVSRLTSESRVLIAEACTHTPQTEDIGRVKLPRLLYKRVGEGLRIDHVNGRDFPSAESLRDYDLVIHCGACMFNRQLVMSRLATASEAQVPMTNYGIAIAALTGILDKVSFA